MKIVELIDIKRKETKAAKKKDKSNTALALAEFIMSV